MELLASRMNPRAEVAACPFCRSGEATNVPTHDAKKASAGRLVPSLQHRSRRSVRRCRAEKSPTSLTASAPTVLLSAFQTH